MQAVRGKVERAGLTPRVIEGAGKSRPVVRLVVGDFAEWGAAQKELDRLRNLKIAGFILKSDLRRYRAYAGSFATEASAAKEQRRLAARGVDLRLENSTISLPTYRLTAGNFPTREAAQEKAGKLLTLGVNAIIIDNS